MTKQSKERIVLCSYITKSHSLPILVIIGGGLIVSVIAERPLVDGTVI